MTETYYIETDLSDNPIALMKLIVDDAEEEVTELLWQDNQWVDTDRIFDGLLNGGVVLQQVNEAEAKMTFPNAFLG